MKRILIFITLLITTCEVNAQEAEFYFLFLNRNPDRPAISQEEEDSLQSAHMNNIERLVREGKLLVAGPFEGGGGIFILDTDTFKQAQEWIMTDPAVQAGRFRLELLPWKKRVGTPCLASTDAKMVKYTFIRYVPHLTKFNIQQSPLLFKEHDDYMVKVRAAHEVITEGIFVPHDGGVLIISDEPDKALIMNDPTVMEGMLYPEFKSIWLAEGSFCYQ